MRTLQEVIKHFPLLYTRLSNELARRSHSAKLNAGGSDLSMKKPDPHSDAEMADATQEPPKKATLLTFMNPAKITEQQRVKIELLMFRMFICCALPWALMNSEFFVAFVLALAPNFVVPDRSAFFPKHLAQESAVWAQEFRKFLNSKTHLTLSLDGWSTRAKDEIYTFHTTTPKRRSFFTDGHVFKGVSVTGDALKGVAAGVSVIFSCNLPSDPSHA